MIVPDEVGWSQVRLSAAGVTRPLGAETLEYIASKLTAFLSDTAPGQRWVFSLSELHVSAYGDHVAGRVVLQFQDAEGRMFATLELTAAEMSEWKQIVSRHTGA